jgi:hypothetical protein
MTTYIYCKWVGSSAEEPDEIYSELDNSRNETRKIERYKNGKVAYASRDAAVNGASLGIIPVPTLAEINASPEFRARQITQAEFEQQWRSATGKR